MIWLATWWVWIALAMLFGIVEVLVPSFFFLGFSIGAILMGLALLVFPALVTGLSVSAMIAIFAGLSLAAWLALRLAFKRQSSGSKIFTKDVND